MNDPMFALDIGNVSVVLRVEECLRAFSMTMDSIPPEFFALARDVETGRASSEAFLDRMEAMLGGTMSRKAIVDAWNVMIGPTVPGMTDAVRELARRGASFRFLSNTSGLHLEQVFRVCGFAHLVSGGIYSHIAGRAKPDRGIYEDFERAWGRPLAFFDDMPENVAGARACGWNAIRFESAEQFFREAEALLP